MGINSDMEFYQTISLKDETLIVICSIIGTVSTDSPALEIASRSAERKSASL